MLTVSGFVPAWFLLDSKISFFPSLISNKCIFLYFEIIFPCGFINNEVLNGLFFVFSIMLPIKIHVLYFFARFEIKFVEKPGIYSAIFAASFRSPRKLKTSGRTIK